MPRGDRTGPEGRGRFTGRGLGYCAGYEEPGYTAGSGWFGRGGRGGRGRRFWGRGRGWGFFGPGPGAYGGAEPVDEKNLLEEEKSYLEQRLESNKQRLGETE